jgi:hypothetical protein
MAKSTEKSDPSAADVAAEPSVQKVTLIATRTFLDSLNGKTVVQGDPYETTPERAAELIQMGCLAKPE